ncbi:MAG: phosphoribosyltransferase [Patescibacteria group bacterium]
MKNPTKKKCIDILNSINAVQLSFKNEFEAKPGVFAPVYVDIKKALSSPCLRTELVNELVPTIPDHTTHICGIESGGTYYASQIADLRSLKLIFLRSKRKHYGVKSMFVGDAPTKGSHIAFIDDVIATGATLKKTLDLFPETDASFSFHTIFSYDQHDYIADKTGIPISTLLTFSDLNKQDHEAWSQVVEHVKGYRSVVDSNFA